MIWWGVFALGYVGYQVGATNLLNRGVQQEARQDFTLALVDRVAELPPPVTVTEAPEAPVLMPEVEPAVGEPLGIIRIPKVGLDQVIFEGVTREVLQLGPGRIPGTAVPGQPGNAVVSGHRTTYGAPFFSLDELKPGDVIEVETALGVHSYTVRESIIVSPTDVWVTDSRDGAWLTLTTCNPVGSARERLIVFAELSGGPNFDFVASMDF